MTRFTVADDGHGEPTVWRTPDAPARSVALFRRCDLPPAERHLWPEIVRRMLLPEIVVDILQAKATVDAAPAYRHECDSRCRPYQ